MRRIAWWLAAACLVVGAWALPPQWLPWTPLTLDMPPGPFTTLKLKRLSDDPAACRALLAEDPVIRVEVVDDFTSGDCRLANQVRVQRTAVEWSSSYLAHCPLAVAWVLYERHRLMDVAQTTLGGSVVRVEHVISMGVGRPDVASMPPPRQLISPLSSWRTVSGSA